MDAPTVHADICDTSPKLTFCNSGPTRVTAAQVLGTIFKNIAYVYRRRYYLLLYI